MKDRKFEISIIVFMVVFSIIIFGASLLIQYINKKNTYILITNPYSIFECKKNKCEDVSDNLEEYNNKEYNVYKNYFERGINKVFYNESNNTFHVYDSFNNNIYEDINDSLLAYSGKIELTVNDFNIEEMNINKVYEVLYNADINYQSDDLFSQKISLDFDFDTEYENLYIITNSGYEDKNIYFSILAYEKDQNIYIIDKEISDSNFGLFVSRITNIIDLNNDNKIEFINTKLNCDETEYCSVIYRLKGKSFESMNECKKKTIFNY